MLISAIRPRSRPRHQWVEMTQVPRRTSLILVRIASGQPSNDHAPIGRGLARSRCVQPPHTRNRIKKTASALSTARLEAVPPTQCVFVVHVPRGKGVSKTEHADAGAPELAINFTSHLLIDLQSADDVYIVYVLTLYRRVLYRNALTQPPAPLKQSAVRRN